MTATARFETHRSRLLGLGYRMLGSRADAEDVVQEAWLKWARTDRSAIESDEAYLTTIVTRLCLDRIKRERPQRLAYVGLWLPEPITDADTLRSQEANELADDLSYALLLSLERLSALERAAFLLHDVFDTPFTEIAAMLDRNEAAVRQLAARARRSVRQAKPQRPATREAHTRLLTAFMAAVRNGDSNALKILLREDAVAMTDSGGHTLAAPVPIRGADRVVRLFLGGRRKFAGQKDAVSGVQTSINGHPGFLIYRDGVLDAMLTFSTEDERIAAIYIVRNPEKLAHCGGGEPLRLNRSSPRS